MKGCWRRPFVKSRRYCIFLNNNKDSYKVVAVCHWTRRTLVIDDVERLAANVKEEKDGKAANHFAPILSQHFAPFWSLKANSTFLFVLCICVQHFEIAAFAVVGPSLAGPSRHTSRPCTRRTGMLPASSFMSFKFRVAGQEGKAVITCSVGDPE